MFPFYRGWFKRINRSRVWFHKSCQTCLDSWSRCQQSYLFMQGCSSFLPESSEQKVFKLYSQDKSQHSMLRFLNKSIVTINKLIVTNAKTFMYQKWTMWHCVYKSGMTLLKDNLWMWNVAKITFQGIIYKLQVWNIIVKVYCKSITCEFKNP